MNPYPYVYDATKRGESLLSLCCGIGLELEGLRTESVTAVDVVPQYLEQVKWRCPQAECICADALTFIRFCSNDKYDVISIIDGIEHMAKRDGRKLIKQMKRVVKERILLFTPQGPHDDGYLRNEPHNAWGIEGADEPQRHLSGWTQRELEALGFTLLEKQEAVSQHDEPYVALMMEYVK
jgi:ubiquinone/menaquinone biosynthesis C-methylase UbiE